MTPKIAIDRETCVGAGMCVVAASDVFDQDSVDGRVILLDENFGEEASDRVREAVLLCPSGALTLVDDSNRPA